jgi:HEPN domain-containing protein
MEAGLKYMDYGSSYYDIAVNEYQYFQHVKTIVNSDFNNPLAIQAQQIVEKLLKHIIESYCQDNNVTQLLRSHKLHSIYMTIHRIHPQFQLNRDDLIFLSSFYYDARYPGVDYVKVKKEDAIRCIRVVEEVKEKVDEFIESQKG